MNKKDKSIMMSYVKEIEDLKKEILLIKYRLETLEQSDNVEGETQVKNDIERIYVNCEMRKAIREYINKYALENKIPYGKLWNEVYLEFDNTYKIGLYSRNAWKDKSTLKIIEELGYLNIFRVFIENYFCLDTWIGNGKWTGDGFHPTEDDE